MPDFAKALEELKRGLKPETSFLRAPLQVAHNSTLPPGEIVSNCFGSHYVIRAIYPEDYFHGKVRLSRFSSSDLEWLMRLMREMGTVPGRNRIVFLDTETTGMQGGAGMCPFLIGLGYFADDEFRIAQLFIRDFDEEPSMLLALGDFLAHFELV